MSVINIENKKQLNEFINEDNVVVKYSAEWCGPCRRIQPLYEEQARIYTGINFGHVDVDQVHVRISSLPTFIFYKDGEIINKLSGASGSELKKILSKM